jgi:hypothetical protein
MNQEFFYWASGELLVKKSLFNKVILSRDYKKKKKIVNPVTAQNYEQRFNYHKINLHHGSAIDEMFVHNDLSRVHTTPCRVVSSKIIISDWLNHIVTSRYTV